MYFRGYAFIERRATHAPMRKRCLLGALTAQRSRTKHRIKTERTAHTRYRKASSLAGVLFLCWRPLPPARLPCFAAARPVLLYARHSVRLPFAAPRFAAATTPSR